MFREAQQWEMRTLHSFFHLTKLLGTCFVGGMELGAWGKE